MLFIYLAAKFRLLKLAAEQNIVDPSRPSNVLKIRGKSSRYRQREMNYSMYLLSASGPGVSQYRLV